MVHAKTFEGKRLPSYEEADRHYWNNRGTPPATPLHPDVAAFIREINMRNIAQILGDDQQPIRIAEFNEDQDWSASK